MWDGAISPLLLRPLLAPGAAAAAAAPLPGPGAAAVPLSARAAAAAAAAAGSALGGGSAAAAAVQAAKPPARMRPVCCLFVLERLFQLLTYEPLLHQMLLALVAGEPASGTSAGSGACSCRRALVEMLGSGQPYPAVLALRLLVAVLANRYVSADLLEALCLLPRRRVMGAAGNRGGGPGVSSGGGADVGDPHLLLEVCLEQLRAAAADGVADPWGAAAAARGNGGGSSSGSSGGAVFPLVSLLTRLYLPSQLREVPHGAGGRRGTTSSGSGRQVAGADGVDSASSALERLNLSGAWQACCAASSSGGSGSSSGAKAVAAAGLMPFGEELTDALVALLSQPTLPSQGLWLTGWLLFQLLPVDAEAAAAAAAAQAVPLQHAATPSASSRGASEGSESAEEEEEEASADPGSTPPSVSGTSAGGTSTAAGSAAAAAAVAAARPVAAVPSYSSLAPCPAAASPAQLEALGAALEAAQVELREHVTGIWCEALGPMVALEWPTAREGLQRPMLRASSEALLSGPHACAPAAAVYTAAGGGGAKDDGLSQSARAALAAYLVVHRVVGLLQLKEVGLGDRAPEVQGGAEPALTIPMQLVPCSSAPVAHQMSGVPLTPRPDPARPCPPSYSCS
jgi:hypothetical protein